MTKQQAVDAMREGHKVRHRYFTDDEWIAFKNGDFVDEQDYIMGPEFWDFRKSEAWETGWSVYPS
jgi:hypothetical protein